MWPHFDFSEERCLKGFSSRVDHMAYAEVDLGFSKGGFWLCKISVQD